MDRGSGQEQGRPPSKPRRRARQEAQQRADRERDAQQQPEDAAAGESRSNPRPPEPPLTCLGCQAKDAEIAWLRRALDRAEDRADSQQDRLLALASPLALAQVRGEPLAPPAPQLEVTHDEKGQGWVSLYGRKVRVEDYEKVLAGEGVIDGNGQLITADDMARAEQKLNEMLGGSASQ